MKRISGLKFFVGIIVIIVIATVAVGFYIAGSPEQERARRFDSQRISDLQQIAASVDSSFERTGKLPSGLQDFVVPSKKEFYHVRSLADPKTEIAYEYRIIGTVHYELCATFDLPSTKNNEDGGIHPAIPAQVPYEYYGEGPTPLDWSHAAGRYCFNLNAEARGPRIPCSLQNPCAAGQACVVLPGRSSAVCVPAGKECDAAGCFGQCSIAESYPAQVRCPNIAQ